MTFKELTEKKKISRGYTSDKEIEFQPKLAKWNLKDFIALSLANGESKENTLRNLSENSDISYDFIKKSYNDFMEEYA